MEKYDPLVYNADLYLRLSKEDGDSLDNANKQESNSIVNQKELIKAFVGARPDIRIHAVRVDDGYSGVDFQRPGFQSMLEDIKAGKVNCVIVKDLSRFGRNYIEVGKYIEKIFPYLGVRFIAINDNYDSMDCNNPNDDIIIPFKNLINDAYSRDISVKIRSNLEVKRKRGDYMGAFAPYGYEKSEEDKNKLVIDERGAQVVRDIYNQYLQGNSAYKIANYLNQTGVLSPMDYKRSMGHQYYTGFREKSIGEWNHNAVLRILKNTVYAGNLVQGKYTTPNYKIKKRTLKDESLWNKAEKTHEAIIAPNQYDNVQRLLKMDTRTGNFKNQLYCMSGMIKCGDCRSNMSRKTVPSVHKNYVYYVCGNNKYNKKCSSHSINAKQLEKCILKLLNNQIKYINIERFQKSMEDLSDEKNQTTKKINLVEGKQKEIDKYNNILLELYEDYQYAIITKEEYMEFKDLYKSKLENANHAMDRLKDETGTMGCFLALRENGVLEELTREVAATFIDTIFIYEKQAGEKYGRLEVKLKGKVLYG